jgi:hypothetical protein
VKAYRELRVTSPTLDDNEIIAFVEGFAQTAAGWSFPEIQSREYAHYCGCPSCCLLLEAPTGLSAAVHLTSSGADNRAKGVYVSNIVPLKSASLTRDEYNRIAVKVARDLRMQAKQSNAQVRITLSKENLGLRDIVRSKVAWRLFVRYANLFPESSHPNDIARLDAFTCALSRYSRRTMDFDALEHLLVEEMGWPAAIASRCRHRVENGLDILSANKAVSSR